MTLNFWFPNWCFWSAKFKMISEFSIKIFTIQNTGKKHKTIGWFFFIVGKISILISLKNFTAIVFYTRGRKYSSDKIRDLFEQQFMPGRLCFFIWYSDVDSCQSLLETSLGFVIISHRCCQIFIFKFMPFVVWLRSTFG